jgi:hypothetical protein
MLCNKNINTQLIEHIKLSYELNNKKIVTKGENLEIVIVDIELENKEKLFKNKCKTERIKSDKKARFYKIIYNLSLFLNMLLTIISATLSLFFLKYFTFIFISLDSLVVFSIFYFKLGYYYESYNFISLQLLYLESYGTGNDVEEENFRLLTFQLNNKILISKVFNETYNILLHK